MEESISSVINETVDDRSPQARDEEYMLAMVSDEHEREDVSTTASDGDENPRWSKMCKKKTRRRAMETEVQETLDSNTVHNIDEEKITITIDSGAAISAMPKDMLPTVPKSGNPRTSSMEWPMGQ